MIDNVVPLPDTRRRELVVEAMPTVLKIVKQRCALWPSLVRKSGLSFAELVAIGNLELSHVALHFKEAPGASLSVFAWKAIDGAIMNAIEGETRHERAVREGMYRSAGSEHVDRERYGATSVEARQGAVEAYSDAIVAGMLMSLAAADPEHQVMAGELHDKVQRALSELSAKDGRLIRLHYFEDQTLEAAGIALGISKSTVKRRHQNILQRLGARLLTLGVDGA